MPFSDGVRRWLWAGSPLWRLACALCWAVVLTGMLAPASEVSPFVIQGLDKVIHLLALAGMMFTARQAFPAVPAGRFWSFAVVVAVVLECLQPVVQPDRDFSLFDMAANVAGVGLAALTLRGQPHRSTP